MKYKELISKINKKGYQDLMFWFIITFLIFIIFVLLFGYLGIFPDLYKRK